MRERAEHVAKNRRKMLGDMRDEVEAAASEYRALVDQLEQTRRELLELRQTEVWVADLPQPTLTNEPSTAALVGAKRRLQEAYLPGLQQGVVANAIFSLLRADVGCCSRSRPSKQAAAEQGVTAADLTKSDARWMENSKVDLVGPAFASTWGGSDEEKAEAERVRAYAEAQRKRLWE